MNLHEFGLIGPQSFISQSPTDAIRIAQKLGYPVALKIKSLDILHKTDIGGVRLGLMTSKEVESAYLEIIENVKTHFPNASIEGIEVQEMIKDGIEVIIGLFNDPNFGMTIMFGLGGVFTELLKDVSFRVLPINSRDAKTMLTEIKGNRILNGYRNMRPVSEEMLIDLLLTISDKGYFYKDELEAVDLNPIMVWENQYRVIDAKFIPKTNKVNELFSQPPNTLHLEKFFNPRSIAVIGASNTIGKVGNGVFDSLVNGEYKGKVFPVNPNNDFVMGKKSYPSLTSVPEPIDLAVMSTDISYVPSILNECKTKNINNMIIISGGGKELGGNKIKLESDIKNQAKENNVRIIGPNCTGVFDGRSRIDTFFQSKERMLRPKDGLVGFMTQSGAVGAAFLEDAHAFGVRHYVSYGNRVDVDEADLLALWGNDPEIKVIGLYVEGFEDGRKFVNTANEISQKKPIVIYKSARTTQGANASASHTGSLGNSYKVVEGALRQAGVLNVNSYDELVAAIKALAMQPESNGDKIGMISNGAGSMIQAIDYLTELKMELPLFSGPTIKTLQNHYPDYYIYKNPIDVTGSGTSEDYEFGIKAMLEDPNIDIVMPWFVFVNSPLEENIIDKLGELNSNYSKPILIGAFGGKYSKSIMKQIENQGIPTFDSVNKWVSAANAISWRFQINK